MLRIQNKLYNCQVGLPQLVSILAFKKKLHKLDSDSLKGLHLVHIWSPELMKNNTINAQSYRSARSKTYNQEGSPKPKPNSKIVIGDEMDKGYTQSSKPVKFHDDITGKDFKRS
jgi:hypothetical protein